MNLQKLEAVIDFGEGDVLDTRGELSWLATVLQGLKLRGASVNSSHQLMPSLPPVLCVGVTLGWFLISLLL